MSPHSDERFDHESYGAISVGRTTGKATLFMSEAEHQHFIHVTVHHAYMERGLSNDHHYTDKHIVDLYMTESQWAQFVSSVNMGSGVPCTLRFVTGQGTLSMPPRLRPKTERFKKDMQQHLQSVMDRLKSMRRLQKDMVEKPSVGKAREIGVHIDRLQQELEDNLPFVADQFMENVENTLSDAKAEIEAYALHRSQELSFVRLPDPAGDTPSLPPAP